MRIGLIGINRYAPYLNFACDLHAYAFQQFLENHGYESAFLDYKPVYHNNLDMRHPAKAAEKDYLEALRTKKGPATLSRLAELAMGYRSAPIERERRFDKFEAFIRNHVVFTEEQYDSDLLEVRDPGFDCYICVTDVIWQTMEKYTFDRGFYLASKAFDGKPKIAYATSRGASADLTETELELFSRNLSRFDAISVRETDFCSYIQANTDAEVTTVLDPVLLHDGEFWSNISVEPREQGYVLLYYVMERSTDTIAKAVEYAKLHGLILVELSDRPLKFGRVTDPDVKHVPRYDVGMDEWLGYIRNADAVFTNSFHACCFSMLFEKLFFVGSRHGQKVPNFLSTFGLSDQSFDAAADVSKFTAQIDFTPARATLQTLRDHSSDFLFTALKQAAKWRPLAVRQEIRKADALRHEITYPIRFHSGSAAGDSVALRASNSSVKLTRLKTKKLEYHWASQEMQNDGASQIPANLLLSMDQSFVGWTLRFRVDNRWFWYLNDGTVEPSNVDGTELNDRKAVLSDQSVIPYLPVTHISMVVLVARWAEDESGRSRAAFESTEKASI